MAKPIVVMYIPRDGYYSDTHGEPPFAILMRMLNGNYGQDPEPNQKVVFPVYWTDYYWLVFPKEGIEVPELQVFYDRDFKPINFYELKTFIEKTLANDSRPRAGSNAV